MPQQDFSRFISHGENKDRGNFARLLCLLVEQGTECMKNYVLTNLPKVLCSGEMQSLIPNRRGLTEALMDKKNIFKDLKKRKKISNEVYKQLYPASGVSVCEEKLDMTCWYVLARNLAVNKQPKVNYCHFEVHPPKVHQQLPQHNIIRIRNMRNTLFHLDSTNLDSLTFNMIWTDLAVALTMLGTPKSVIEDYKSRDLNPITTMAHYARLREQVYLELENVYNWEIKKKKYLITSLIVLGMLLVAGALASNCITYFYARTWSSCIHSMTTHLTDNGAISFMPRKGWGAKPAKALNPPLKTPLQYVVISHTAETGWCSTTDNCCNTAQVTQEISLNKNFDDVAYNYMVGNDGVIYEGCGERQSPGMVGWNQKSVTIGFLGKYVTSPPTAVATDAAEAFLQYLVDNKVLHRNFTLYGLCQVLHFPDAPGAALYQIIQTWHGEGPNTWSWRHHSNETCRTKLPK